MPVDEVDEVIALKPPSCATCHHELVGEAPRPHRHQVFEIPPMRPVVIDYQVHRLSCGGVAKRRLGPGLRAYRRGSSGRGPKRLRLFVPVLTASPSVPHSGCSTISLACP